MSELRRSSYRNKHQRRGEGFDDDFITSGTTDEDCEIIKAFKGYACKLDAKWDKFERIVKLSRDVTIESKRIIFLLHQIDRENNKPNMFNEAERRLDALITHQLRSITKELEKEDLYLYHRAFSPGMQEFMEAFLYFNYLKNKRLYELTYYQDKLKCSSVSETESMLPDGKDMDKKQIKSILVQSDLILGLADATGEFMRKCINNLGTGNTEGSFETCSLVRNLYCGFLTIDLSGQKEMSRKTFTLKQSLLKMEMACYNVQVRGSEYNHLVLDIDPSKTYVHEDK
ncbi:hypothetical protein RUM44_001254 [Polyplax serrata]|uniref:Translin-associated protein X n=1 Tax=Polyplax serrata TaxID=468196 RepID=A0ABR1AJI5_POLSC